MDVRLLIGIDDTDSPDSRGTGFLARQMGELIVMNGLGKVRSISRHYLKPFSVGEPEIENSAICIELMSSSPDELRAFCRTFVSGEAQPSASPGLAIVSWDCCKDELIHWGREAKQNTLSADEAVELAATHDVFLEGWKGGSGRIGALAATGLRRTGNDGRFIWLERLRELHGTYSAEDLIALTDADIIVDTDGRAVNPDDLIEVGDWVRPVIRDHQITIVVRANPKGKCPWVATNKEYIYHISR